MNAGNDSSEIDLRTTWLQDGCNNYLACVLSMDRMNDGSVHSALFVCLFYSCTIGQ